MAHHSSKTSSRYLLISFSQLCERPESTRFRTQAPGVEMESYPFYEGNTGTYVEVRPHGINWRYLRIDLNPVLRLSFDSQKKRRARL